MVSFEQVGRLYQSNRSFEQVEISGNYLFAGTASNGWQVLDVSDPEVPTSVFENTFDRDLWGMRVQGNELFLDFLDHFGVYEVSLASSPVLSGGSERSSTLNGLPLRFHGLNAPDAQYHLARYAYDDATKIYSNIRRTLFGLPALFTLAPGPGSELLLGGSASGLYVIQYDAARAEPLFVIGHASTNPVYSICISTNLAVAACGNKGVEVFDLTKPGAPLLLRRVGFFGTVYNVDVSGQVGYAANGAYGVGAIDLSNTSQINQIGNFNTPGKANDLCSSGNYVYVADGTNGVLVLKATLKPADPPVFTLLPPTNIVLRAHEDLSVTVAASGNEPITFYWHRGDSIILQGGPQLTIQDITPEQQGHYKVIAASPFSGSTEAQFNVRVYGEPRLLFDYGPDFLRLDLRSGSELYSYASYPYLEIESSTNLVTWNSFFKNPVRDYEYFPRDTNTPNLFFRLVEHAEPLP